PARDRRHRQGVARLRRPQGAGATARRSNPAKPLEGRRRRARARRALPGERTMIGEAITPAEEVQELLREYLREGGERNLHGSYELGRRALAAGVGILGLSECYQKAVSRLLRESGCSEECLRILSEAGVLLAESLAPYEMAHLTSREAS